MGQGSLACIRYLLFAFTLVFVIFGSLLIYSGLTTFISFHKYDLVVQTRPDGATIVLLVAGLAIFLTAFMGCCGAITNNAFMLRTFSFIITVLLIVELVTVSFIFAFRKTIHENIQKGINEAIIKFNETDSDSAITRMIDDIQQNFHCCGANSTEDWQNNPAYQNETLPRSCCGKDLSNSTQCIASSPLIYDTGCVDIITDELKSSVGHLAWLGIVVVVIQVIGICFSCTLSNSGRRDYTYV